MSLASSAKILLLSYNSHSEYYIGAIALIFLSAGVLVGILHKSRASKANTIKISMGDKLEQDTYMESINDLTARENEVLNLIAQGLTNAEISEKLFISLNTTKSHIQKIYSKLDVKNRTQALNKARNTKIIL